MLNTILDNVGTMVAFRSKSIEIERLLLHHFSPYVEQGEIVNLPAFNFCMKIAAVNLQEPVSGETVVLPKDDADEQRAGVVIASFRKLWSIEHDADKISRTGNSENKVVKEVVDAPEVQSKGLLGSDMPLA